MEDTEESWVFVHVPGSDFCVCEYVQGCVCFELGGRDTTLRWQCLATSRIRQAVSLCFDLPAQ